MYPAGVSWDDRFQELLRWRDTNGHSCVPKAEGALGRWVARQRELRKCGKLLPERETKLLSLGFTWNTNDAAWDGKYQVLLEWRHRAGHCCVPTGDGELGMWVAKQRQLYRQKRLAHDRVRKLELIGFVWSTSSADWEEKYEDLLKWRSIHGHSRVPFNEGELGWWVNTQRQNKRKGKLSVDRERLLNEIGFVWDPQHHGRKRDYCVGDVADTRAHPCSNSLKRSRSTTSLDELDDLLGLVGGKRPNPDTVTVSTCSLNAESSSCAKNEPATVVAVLPDRETVDPWSTGCLETERFQHAIYQDLEKLSSPVSAVRAVEASTELPPLASTPAFANAAAPVAPQHGGEARGPDPAVFNPFMERRTSREPFGSLVAPLATEEIFHPRAF